MNFTIRTTLLMLLPALIIGINHCTAQTVFIGKNARQFGEQKAPVTAPKQDNKTLAAISDTMFQEGNPRYIWIDLLKDGYINNGTDESYYLSIDLHISTEDIESALPAPVQQEYAHKWIAFVKHIGQSLRDSVFIMNIDNGMHYSQFSHPSSAFRTYNKRELFNQGLAASGEIRVLNEIVKDNLAASNKPYNFHFSKRWYSVNQYRLDDKQKAKYARIFIEEFEDDFLSNTNWIFTGSNNHTVSDEIKKLSSGISALKNSN